KAEERRLRQASRALLIPAPCWASSLSLYPLTGCDLACRCWDLLGREPNAWGTQHRAWLPAWLDSLWISYCAMAEGHRCAHHRKQVHWCDERDAKPGHWRISLDVCAGRRQGVRCGLDRLKR